jgi:hypothetical protein
VKGYLGATRSPAVSIAVTLPLLLLYNLGLLMPGNREMNATDLLSRTVVSFAGVKGFLAVNGALVLLSLGLILWLVRKGRFRYGQWLGLCVEGLLYGLGMGYAVTWFMGQAHLLAAIGERSYSLLESLSISAGAGYWEELVFRLAMVGGPIAAASRWSRGRAAWARIGGVAVASVLVSSVLFSLAHYVGGLETPEWQSFWYRALSGIVFSAVFLARGFAVAAYTHFLYDVVVFVF